MRTFLPALFLASAALVAAAPFDPVRDVQISFRSGAVQVEVPPGCHLKARFLEVTLASGEGRVVMGELPVAKDRDELGDPIYHGAVRIPVTGQGLGGFVVLEVRYQPCTEGPEGVCYRPMTRTLGLAGTDIPAGAPAVAPTSAPGGLVLDGGLLDLASLKGRVALVDFWASWCAPCRKSFPVLERFKQAYGSKGLEVVGVSLDEDADAMNRFLESVPVSFRILRDPRGQLAQTCQVVAMPTTLLLDTQGRVVARFEGGAHGTEEEAAVKALLAGKPLPAGTGALAAKGTRATGSLRAWDRGHLADPIMNLDGDPLARGLWEHIHSAKEGAAGNGGAAGGGCGCN